MSQEKPMFEQLIEALEAAGVTMTFNLKHIPEWRRVRGEERIKAAGLPLKVEDLTCSRCSAERVCEYAWNPLNVDGKCARVLIGSKGTVQRIANRLGIQPLISTTDGTVCVRECQKYDAKTRRCSLSKARVVTGDSECSPLVTAMVVILEGGV